MNNPGYQPPRDGGRRFGEKNQMKTEGLIRTDIYS
jgi:hypothetical protein